MTHPFLADPANQKAYQALVDCPRGSSRAWATQADWTHSRMRTFLKNLVVLGLARIVKLPHGSLFEPVSTCANLCEPVSTCAIPYLGSKSNCDKVPRYVGSNGGTEKPVAESAEAALIEALNLGILENFRDFHPIPATNRGSIAAAKRILKVVPLERAERLVREAGRIFTPDKTGGDLPRSLGHPFFTRYAINESKRIDRESAAEQLPLIPAVNMQVERPKPEPPDVRLPERTMRLLAGEGPTWEDVKASLR